MTSENTIPKLTLYRMSGSCALVSHAILHELDLPFTAIPMTINASVRVESVDGTISPEQYFAIHPAGQVPALAVTPPDDPSTTTIITENPAIITYVASLPSNPTLLGTNAIERAQIHSWLSFLSGSVHGQAYGALWRPRRYVDGEAHPEAEEWVRQAGRKNVERFYGMIEERLPGDGFAVGGRLSVADFNLYLFWRWGVDLGLEMGRWKNWEAVARGIEGREAVRRCLDVEGLKVVFV
ncbi:hypothetical protein OQA88_12734 [Cercophora sp. LCS_1]